VSVNGFSGGDHEVFALDVQINGVQATPDQISTLVANLNSDNAYGAGAQIASAVDPTNGAFSSFAPSVPYNLFLATDSLSSDLSYFGFDLSQDPTFAASAKVVAIAVVPEPGSASLITLTATALLAKSRRRRRSINEPR